MWAEITLKDKEKEIKVKRIHHGIEKIAQRKYNSKKEDNGKKEEKLPKRVS